MTLSSFDTSISGDSAVRCQWDGSTAWIILDRPDKRNTLPEANWQALVTALDCEAVEVLATVLVGVDEVCRANDVTTLADVETVARFACSSAGALGQRSWLSRVALCPALHGRVHNSDIYPGAGFCYYSVTSPVTESDGER